MPGSAGNAITDAWCLTAYLMPAAMSSGSREVSAVRDQSGSPGLSVTLSERILASSATP